MNSRNAGIIIFNLEITCPFCKYDCKNPTFMRWHLKRVHTDMEAEKYIKRENTSTSKYFEAYED